MITFAARPSNPKEPHRLSRDYSEANDLMDIDEFQDLDASGSRILTCPGEYLTSSQTYMRCGLDLPIVKEFYSDLALTQWSWDLY
jgi:hypothetical protein